MEFDKEQIEQVKQKLTEFRRKVGDNDKTLHRTEDSFEISNERGDRIWLHPKEDGETVDIHIMAACIKEPDVTQNDVNKREWSEIRTKISGHLTALGCRDVFTPFVGNYRVNLRINFSEMGPVHEEMI